MRRSACCSRSRTGFVRIVTHSSRRSTPLVTLDSLYARARYAIAFGCAPTVLAADGRGFSIRDGRHPLLLARNRSSVVPFALTMEAGEHTLLVSGPNTGGKTVLLKSLALISLMAQAGIPAPVGRGSTIRVFDRFFADIGDEQSIEGLALDVQCAPAKSHGDRARRHGAITGAH